MKSLKIILFISLLLICPPIEAQSRQVKAEHPASYYIDRARQSMQSKSWNAMRKTAEKGLAEYPDNVNLRYLLGRYYEHSGNYDKARYNFIRALSEDPNHIDSKRSMINVETQSGHYSNALAYCNDMLETIPYDKGIWRKKIELYRKMGDTKTANSLLDRMSRIFPNDKDVTKDVEYQKETSYTSNMKKGALKEAATQLEELINNNPNDRQYYVDLINVYKRRGMYDSALSTAEAALAQFGNATPDFLKQKVALLSSMGRTQEALNYLNEQKKRGSSLASQLYDQVFAEAVTQSRMNDPYEMTAKQYEKTHNPDDLNYLLNTAIKKGYYDDAMYYLQKLKGADNSKKRLMLEYEIELRAGHNEKAQSLLQRIYELDPNDKDIAELYGRKLLRNANDEFSQEDYKNAIPHLEEVMKMGFMDAEEISSAKMKILSSYMKMKQYDTAKLYLKQNSTDATEDEKKMYSSIYAEGLLELAKASAENEDYLSTLQTSEEVLDLLPNNDDALRYAINASDAMHNDEKFRHYTELGYSLYPQTPYYIIKKAALLSKDGNKADAKALLESSLSKMGYDRNLGNGFADISEGYATALIKENKPLEAITICNNALAYTPNNRSLNYIKGLAYEKMHVLDSAYYYQSQYADVSAIEAPEYNQHLKGLSYKAANDRIDLEYTSISANSQSENSGHAKTYLSSVASLTYSHTNKLNTYSVQVNYKGVEGDLEELETDSRGGVGIQGIFQWDHAFNDKWSGYANVGLANKYFSKVTANINFARIFANNITANIKLGYRNLDDVLKYQYSELDSLTKGVKSSYSMFIATPGISKTWNERITASGQVDCILFDNTFYYNASAKCKMLLADDRVSSITAMAGIGSFPEMSLFDKGLATTSLSKTNTMVALEGQWLIARNLSIGLCGTWYTNYSPKVVNGTLTTYYRNLYSINLQLHVTL